MFLRGLGSQLAYNVSGIYVRWLIETQRFNLKKDKYGNKS